MIDCKFLTKCPFYGDKMAAMPTMVERFKQKYCHSEFDDCARYQARVKLGAGNDPPDLYPNQGNKLPALFA